MELFVSCVSEMEEGFRELGAKLATLWFDKIYFDPFRADLTDRRYESLFPAADMCREDRAILTDIWRPISDIAPHLCLIGARALRAPNWVHEDESFERGWEAVMANYERQVGAERHEDPGFIYADGAALSAVDNISMWSELNSRSPCVMRPSKDEQIAAAAIFAGGSVNNPYGIFESIGAVDLPNLKNVSWSRLAELKKRGDFFAPLREKISEVYTLTAHGDISAAKDALLERIDLAEDELLEGARPRPVRTLIENVVTTLVSPIGLLKSCADTANEIERQDCFAWFYVLRDLKKIAPD